MNKRFPVLTCLSVASLMLLSSASALAQQRGTAVIGATGGLVIPSAAVLEEGEFAFQTNSFLDPKLLKLSSKPIGKRSNYLMGIGLFKGLEVYGRMTDFRRRDVSKTNPYMRDVSANLKYQLPDLFRYQPKLAVGVTNVKGGASFLQSYYVVASRRIGRHLDVSLGYAKGRSQKTFNGFFNGLELYIPDSGISLLGEYDGQFGHAGMRYVSRPIRQLGNAQFSAQLQRSFKAKDHRNRSANQWTYGVAVNIPVGANARKKRYFEPEAYTKPLAFSIEQSGLANLSAQGRIDKLTAALQKVGLERVRVGMVGATLAIQYENHTFAHNEADALGVVLGLASEFAPKEASHITAFVLKNGAVQYYTEVNKKSFSDFLRRGSVTGLLQSFESSTKLPYRLDQVHWKSGEATTHTKARVVIKPELNYFVATQAGNFDYSIGANLGVHVPLWKGAEFYAEHVQHLDSSKEFGTHGLFNPNRVETGMKAVAIQQSGWLHHNVHASIGLGKYYKHYWGGQASLYVLTRGKKDMLKMHLATYKRKHQGRRTKRTEWKGSYRWSLQPQTWLDMGIERYQDQTQGPSINLTKWAGDVGITFNYRERGAKKYVGLYVAVPLTPRHGMRGGGLVSVAGDSSYTTGIGTRISDKQFGGNNHPHTMELLYDVEKAQLNNGRFSKGYQLEQLYRMRESFFLYARQYLS